MVKLHGAHAGSVQTARAQQRVGKLGGGSSSKRLCADVVAMPERNLGGSQLHDWRIDGAFERCGEPAFDRREAPGLQQFIKSAGQKVGEGGFFVLED